MGYDPALGVATVRMAGVSLFSANPRLDSILEQKLAFHAFFGNGKNYYLSASETARLLRNGGTSQEFDQGIGGGLDSDPTTGRIDVYDFNPGTRPLLNEIMNRAGGIVLDYFQGQKFDIYPYTPPYISKP